MSSSSDKDSTNPYMPKNEVEIHQHEANESRVL